jgi:uncharacterized tellurite resistance protein B-like protein
MAFWDIFKEKKTETTKLSTIHAKIVELIPDQEDEKLIKLACISGLLARVAYIDFEVHTNEIDDMEAALVEWGNLSEELSKNIVTIAIEEIKDLAGLENHKYCQPLTNLMKPEERYSLLKALFSIAASDGQVEEKESEEIRIISRGLRLQHQDFISARVSVLNKIKSLMKETK